MHLGLGFFPRSIEGNGFIIGMSSLGVLPAGLLSGRFYTPSGIYIQPSFMFVDDGAGFSIKIGN